MTLDNPDPKSLFICFLWGFGIISSISWLKSLSNIKNNIDFGNELLIEMEKFLPVKIFTLILAGMGRMQGKNSISSAEKTTPILFIIGYLIIGTILLIYPNIL